MTRCPSGAIHRWSAAVGLVCAVLFGAPGGAAAAGLDLAFVQPSQTAVWSAPPAHVPAADSVDAPLLGNGDMGVCLGGPPEALRFYLSKNDFWRLQSAFDQGGPRVFGYLDLRMDSLRGAACRIEQRIADGHTTVTMQRGVTVLEVRSWVAATGNVLVLELAAQGGPVSVQTRLSSAPDQQGATHEDGRAGAVLFAQRTFARDVDMPTQVAAACRWFGQPEPSFTVQPGAPITGVLVMTSRNQQKSPLPFVRAAVGRFKERSLRRWRQGHDAWWRDYWNRGGVRIEDAALQRAYVQSLYTMAAASREPQFPPGLFGNWITTDTPAWAGDYHLNYNFVAPFYALYAANRLAQADPQDGPLLAFRERGRWYAAHVTHTRGVLYPVGIGPLGNETTLQSPSSGYTKGGMAEEGGLFFQQRSDAAYCLVNMAERWRTTYDPTYGKKIYPFVREVVEFWEDYLKFQNGRYVIVGDAIHEGSGWNTNPILTLGLLRNALDLALDLSAELEVDAARRAKWEHMLMHLSQWTTQERDGKTVFRYAEEGPAWYGDNTLGLQHIYPGNALGLDSDPRQLEAARNTIDVMKRWLDLNGSNSFFPAAVRVGYEPTVILDRLRDYVQNMRPNGFQQRNPHGIENCSTVPNTINMMLCTAVVPVGDPQRPESVLRVFGSWPRNRDARFHQIRTWGAFLVSSELKGGQIAEVKLLSERGRKCTIVNPWPGQRVQLIGPGKRRDLLQGERFTFATRRNEPILLKPR